ncbi:MAG TPA: tetratricopeptide repeat protein [Bryobacteraceae bacterium]|nr:tetratricopeptide repeat protein [Bryobacteraceae bacterium]
MSRIRISALLFSACLLHAQADVQTLIQQAVAAEQAGNYTQAVDQFRAALQLQPADVATHVNLGVALAHLSRFDEALSEYQAADKLLPGDPRIALNIALAYQKSGRLTEARDRFETLHASSPQNNQVTMLLADCELQLGKNARVVELLTPLQSRTPDDLGLAYMLGTALLREQRISEGQILLDRILRNGDTPEARFLLGTRMFESGDYPAAVKQFSSAAELNPHLPQLQSFYGQALLNTGDPVGAAKAFREELATNPGDFESNLGLGQILTVHKQYVEAQPFLRRALLTQPDSPAAKLALAQYLESAGKPAEARPYAEAVAALMPKSAEVHATLARIDFDLHLTKEAARQRQQAQAITAANDPGPALNTLAPAFELDETTSGKKVRPSDFRGKSPLVLVFGSYSCPNFRGAADALISLYRRYHSQVQFLLVYIREAHATDNWQSTRNTRDNITLSPAVSYAEKRDHAAMCTRKLHLPFPAVVDGMDGAVEKAYNAWPSRVFVVDEDGRIVYRSRLTELDFHPEDMEEALRRVILPKT